MDENRVTELWNKAVAEVGDATYPTIIARFAALVAADEREECALVADRDAAICACEHGHTTLYGDIRADEARHIAAAIRARSND